MFGGRIILSGLDNLIMLIICVIETFLLCSYLYIFFNLNKKALSELYLKKLKNRLVLLICISTIIFVIIFILQFICRHMSIFSIKGNKIMIIMGTIAVNTILFYGFQKYINIIIENARQYKELLHLRAEVEYLSKAAEYNENCKELLHNSVHYFKIIEQLAYECGNKELYDFAESLNGRFRLQNISEYSDNKILNMVLSGYCMRAENKGVDFGIYVEPGCTLNNIHAIDLVTMLGNMLDNSFEAVEKIENDKSIDLRIFMQENGELCIIKVVNDFEGQLIEKHGKLVTTKKDRGIHGIGFASTSKIAREYNGYLEHYVENGKFNAVLVLGDGCN